jgi:hypothetical protein
MAFVLAGPVGIAKPAEVFSVPMRQFQGLGILFQIPREFQT